MDGYMSLSGLRPWPEERLAEFGRRQYYGVEAGTHDAQGRIDRCADTHRLPLKEFCRDKNPLDYCFAVELACAGEVHFVSQAVAERLAILNLEQWSFVACV